MPGSLISVIIPCYNDGIFLPEAVGSVKSHPASADWELIVINDGSTDPHTIDVLNGLEKKGLEVIHQPNGGLAAARNAGIRHANGKYVLPLDADNRINPPVFRKALLLMEADDEVAMVYTDQVRFGEVTEHVISVGKANLASLVAKNDIDACSLIRKSVLESIGGYDGNMPVMGNEDWDLILNLLLHQHRLVYLPEPGFYYRYRMASMYHTITLKSEATNRAYLFQKYAAYLPAAYFDLYSQLKAEQEAHGFTRHRLSAFKKHLGQHRIGSAIRLLLGKGFGY